MSGIGFTNKLLTTACWRGREPVSWTLHFLPRGRTNARSRPGSRGSGSSRTRGSGGEAYSWVECCSIISLPEPAGTAWDSSILSGGSRWHSRWGRWTPCSWACWTTVVVVVDVAGDSVARDSWTSRRKRSTFLTAVGGGCEEVCKSRPGVDASARTKASKSASEEVLSIRELVNSFSNTYEKVKKVTNNKINC